MEHAAPELTDFERGLVTGILIGEATFGGDGRQPHIILRLHVRHEALFRWLMERFPSTKLYGPYHHGGRSYFHGMARDEPLVEDDVLVLGRAMMPEVDAHAHARLDAMRNDYAEYIALVRGRIARAA